MVGILIAFPQLVTFGLDKQVKVDLDSVEIEVPASSYGGGGGYGYGTPAEGAPDGQPKPGAAATDAILDMLKEAKENKEK